MWLVTIRSGNAFAHVIASRPSNVSIRSKTITLTGSPAFSSAFALAANGGVIVLDGNTYTGTATGLKYRAQDGGQVYTPGITLPGNTAGAGTNYGVALYGQYTGPQSSAGRKFCCRGDVSSPGSVNGSMGFNGPEAPCVGAKNRNSRGFRRLPRP